jgi:Flp pilus assembly protein TadD
MFTRKSSLALIALACAAASPLAASAEGKSFEMASYLGFPGGREVVTGDYKAAIASASKAKAGPSALSPLVSATNLCVAYTATGAFPEARGACDRAVELARREDAMATRPLAASNTATSRALSNRGVLRALNGDASGAAGDFRAAAKLRHADSAAARNLAYLESQPSRVASATAP